MYLYLHTSIYIYIYIDRYIEAAEEPSSQDSDRYLPGSVHKALLVHIFEEFMTLSWIWLLGLLVNCSILLKIGKEDTDRYLQPK